MSVATWRASNLLLVITVGYPARIKIRMTIWLMSTQRSRDSREKIFTFHALKKLARCLLVSKQSWVESSWHYERWTVFMQIINDYGSTGQRTSNNSWGWSLVGWHCSSWCTAAADERATDTLGDGVPWEVTTVGARLDGNTNTGLGCSSNWQATGCCGIYISWFTNSPSGRW